MARHLHLDPSQGLTAQGFASALETLAETPGPDSQRPPAREAALERLAKAGFPPPGEAALRALTRLDMALAALALESVTAFPLPLPALGPHAPQALCALLEGQTPSGCAAPMDPEALAYLLAVAQVRPAPPLRLSRAAQAPGDVAAYCGEADDERELTLLEANLDDLSAELLATLPGLLLSAGALDAWLTPALMKKGRPGHVLSALADPALASDLEKLLFTHTSTLGVRRATVARRALERRWVLCETPWGPVRIKLGLWEGAVVNAAPEYADAEALARASGVALKEVYRLAMAAYAAQGGKPV